MKESEQKIVDFSVHISAVVVLTAYAQRQTLYTCIDVFVCPWIHGIEFETIHQNEKPEQIVTRNFFSSNAAAAAAATSEYNTERSELENCANDFCKAISYSGLFFSFFCFPVFEANCSWSCYILPLYFRSREPFFIKISRIHKHYLCVRCIFAIASAQTHILTHTKTYRPTTEH